MFEVDPAFAFLLGVVVALATALLVIDLVGYRSNIVKIGHWIAAFVSFAFILVLAVGLLLHDALRLVFGFLWRRVLLPTFVLIDSTRARWVRQIKRKITS